MTELFQVFAGRLPLLEAPSVLPRHVRYLGLGLLILLLVAIALSVAGPIVVSQVALVLLGSVLWLAGLDRQLRAAPALAAARNRSDRYTLILARLDSEFRSRFAPVPALARIQLESERRCLGQWSEARAKQFLGRVLANPTSLVAVVLGAVATRPAWVLVVGFIAGVWMLLREPAAWFWVSPAARERNYRELLDRLEHRLLVEERLLGR